MTREEIESALDAGMLQGSRGRGWYDIRRNGQTQAWRTRPREFSIPVKVGLKEAFRIDHYSEGNGLALRLRPDNFNSRTRE